jgi:hypothetical protein
MLLAKEGLFCFADTILKRNNQISCARIERHDEDNTLSHSNFKSFSYYSIKKTHQQTSEANATLALASDVC